VLLTATAAPGATVTAAPGATVTAARGVTATAARGATVTAARGQAGRRPALRRGVANRVVLRRVLAALASATAAVVVGSVASPATAGAAGNFVSDINAARAAAGLPGLAISSDLTAAATRQADAMASSNVLYHTPNLASAICCWASVGENVGMGQSIASIHAAFMASPAHRANILSRSYTQVGVAYAVDGHGSLWVSEIFRRPSGAAPPPAAKIVVHAPIVQAPVKKTVAVPAPSRPAPAKVKTSPSAATNLPVSRNFVRLPIEVAQRSLAEFAVPDAVTGTNPVSRLLDFAAKAAAQN
jgi:uncharacterized protein YkwD